MKVTAAFETFSMRQLFLNVQIEKIILEKL